MNPQFGAELKVWKNITWQTRKLANHMLVTIGCVQTSKRMGMEIPPTSENIR